MLSKRSNRYCSQPDRQTLISDMAYSIGDRINKSAPHHDSIEALWETKWRKPVSCIDLRRGTRHDAERGCKLQVLDRNLSLLRRQAGGFRACLYGIDRGLSAAWRKMPSTSSLKSSVQPPPTLRLRRLRRSLLSRSLGPRTTRPSR